MTFDLSQYVPPIINKNEVQNAGSFLLLGALPSGFDGETGPPEITVTAAAAAVAVDDETMDVTASAEFTLRKGAVLHFGVSPLEDKVIVSAADQVVAVGTTTIDIEPVTTGNDLTGSETAITWGLLELQGTTDIPLPVGTTQVDAKDLKFGLQGRNVTVETILEPTINMNLISRDEAFYRYVYEQVSESDCIYALIFRQGGFHAFGAARIQNFDMPGAVNEIARPTFTMRFQSPWWQPTNILYLDTSKQTALNEGRRRAGLLELATT